MNPVLAHWSASWPALIVYVALAGAHLTGLARLRPAGHAALREAAVFQAGLLVALLAFVSPVGYWSGTYIWVRALQDLALAIVAPGLIVLGAPWAALARCLGRELAAGEHPPWWLRQPVAVVVAFNVIWLAWHVPALFDQVPASAAAAVAEYLLYLGAGTWFWLQLIGSRPWSPASPPLRRAAMLVGTVVADTVLGMVLVFGSGVLYPAYQNAAHHVMTVVDDQQLAGAILWMGMLPPVIVAAVAVLIRWLGDEESAALSAGFDGLLAQRGSAWPSRPRFR
jgi:cytochrome c oxidase assembly factor CtaG